MYRWQVYERDDRLGRFVDRMDSWVARSADAYPKLAAAGTLAGAAYGWGRDTFDRRGRSGIAATGYNPGNYDAGSVPFRDNGGSRARGPKNWDQPDQPWPTADSSTAGGGAGGGKPKTHFNSTVRYEKY